MTAITGPPPGQPLAHRNAQLDQHNARTLARVAIETSVPEDRPIAGATAGGDEQKLRGVPCYARGVGGALAGSRPEVDGLG